MPYKNVPEELQGKMESCVLQLTDKGTEKESAIAICYASVVDGQSAAYEHLVSHFEGKRNNAQDETRLQSIHDLSVENGARCSLPMFAEWGSMYLVDEYVATRPGEPYRLFPFGRIVKNGKTRDITPEYAALFKLPHFKPPIKLGSHDQTTPAGGHIIGLEVRADGLWAMPEVNDTGSEAIQKGAYRYHSPEVIWDDSGFEDPKTGEIIAGPLIVGDALLHTPHLGESAALYTVNLIQEVQNMTDDETVKVDKNLWEQFTALWTKLFPAPELTPEPEPVVTVAEIETTPNDEFAAVARERDELAAKVQNMEAQTAYRARVDGYTAKIKETKAEPNGSILAALTDEQADWVLTQFKALSEQIKESALIGEIGSNQPALAPMEALDAAVKTRATEKGIFYQDALAEIRKEQPGLFEALK
jgi:hypothetical protein